MARDQKKLEIEHCLTMTFLFLRAGQRIDGLSISVSHDNLPRSMGMGLEHSIFLLVPEEAIIKAGGSRQQLDAAVAGGRVIRAMQGKLPMFFFPRREYSRESLVRQKLAASDLKIGDADGVVKTQEDLCKDFQWDPANFIPSSLGSIGQSSMAIPMLGNLEAAASSSSQASLIALPSPTSDGAITQRHRKEL